MDGERVCLMPLIPPPKVEYGALAGREKIMNVCRKGLRFPSRAPQLWGLTIIEEGAQNEKVVS